MDTSRRHLVLVPHTHWDREWYRTHEGFRLRLVRLVDRLLSTLESDPGYRHFMLDGQTIVLDDYLAVRPEARERIVKLVESGRLLIGPWTVLPDEWLVSGEALVRNLRNGLAQAERYGGAMRLGYVPDQFGHVGQLPQILSGFGMDAAVLWRGVGENVDRTLFRWQARDGSEVFGVYMPGGYSNAERLPTESAAFATRLRREVERLEPFAATPTLLLMNGVDHAEPQPELPGLLAGWSEPGWSAEIGTLPAFVERARREAPDELPLHRGELRSGLRAPLLPGCASARMPQKQADFRNDRLLTRYLEPVSAWWGSLGGRPDVGLIDFVWRLALENHPHDSICGCSVDEVHDQMDVRFSRAAELAEGELERAFRGLADLVAAPAAPTNRQGAPALPTFVGWNPVAAGRAPGEVELDLEDDEGLPQRAGAPVALRVVGADGSARLSRCEVASPREVLFALPLPPRATRTLLGQLGPDFLGYEVRDVRFHEADGRFFCRLHVGRSPADPEHVAARVRALEDAVARTSCEAGHFELVRSTRLRVGWVDDWPGHGLRTYRLARGRARRPAELRGEGRSDGGVVIENAFLRVEVDAQGRVAVVPRDPSGRSALPRIDDAIRIVSEGDRGDEYNFDPVPSVDGGARDGDPVSRPERVRVGLERPTALGVGVRIRARYRVPRELAPDRGRRGERRVSLPVDLRLRLHPGIDRLDVEVDVDNTARDHRLRLLARAPFEAERFEVESAFEVVERPIAPDPDPPGWFAAERPIGAVPQRAFATLRAPRGSGSGALTVANRGNAEAEAVPEPDGTTSLAVTLLRAVGWLSRGDLWTRPMLAGPPFATPGAQVAGRHRAELSLRWHAYDDAWRTAEAHRFAAPPVAVQGGTEGDAPLGDGARLLELDDPGIVLSAVEPRPEGAAVVRFYNTSHGSSRAVVRFAQGRTIEAVTLDERPDPELHLETADGGAVVELRPWQIATLRVH